MDHSGFLTNPCRFRLHRFRTMFRDTARTALRPPESLCLWTGSDRFGYSVALSAGSSRIEPGITPRRQVVLSWENFTDATNEAGLSRRYGGIHFRRADLVGRLLG
jgi:hypothetical protein